MDLILQKSLDTLHAQIEYHNHVLVGLTPLTEKIRLGDVPNRANARSVIIDRIASLVTSEREIMFDIQKVRNLL